MRTTVDIADPVLDDVRRLQEREGKTLGEVVTELIAEGLAARRMEREPKDLHWIAKHLGAGIDLRDKDALWEILDRKEDEPP